MSVCLPFSPPPVLSCFHFYRAHSFLSIHTCLLIFIVFFLTHALALSASDTTKERRKTHKTKENMFLSPPSPLLLQQRRGTTLLILTRHPTINTYLSTTMTYICILGVGTSIIRVWYLVQYWNVTTVSGTWHIQKRVSDTVWYIYYQILRVSNSWYDIPGIIYFVWTYENMDISVGQAVHCCESDSVLVV